MWVWFPEGQEGLIGSLRRATVQKTDDSGTQQILKNMTGLKSETFEDVYRPQPHGISSHAPKGSEGVYLALGGRSDRLLALGFEHKDHRPKDTPEGGTIIYDHTGDAIRVVKDKIDHVHSKEINLKIAKGYDKGKAVDEADGPVIALVMKKGDSITVTFDDSSVKLESGKITHTSPHVVIKSDRVDLGDEGGDPVGLCSGGCATKVYAV
jgi:phage gp45-like